MSYREQSATRALIASATEYDDAKYLKIIIPAHDTEDISYNTNLSLNSPSIQGKIAFDNFYKDIAKKMEDGQSISPSESQFYNEYGKLSRGEHFVGARLPWIRLSNSCLFNYKIEASNSEESLHTIKTIILNVVHLKKYTDFIEEQFYNCQYIYTEETGFCLVFYAPEKLRFKENNAEIEKDDIISKILTAENWNNKLSVMIPKRLNWHNQNLFNIILDEYLTQQNQIITADYLNSIASICYSSFLVEQNELITAEKINDYSKFISISPNYLQLDFSGRMIEISEEEYYQN